MSDLARRLFEADAKFQRRHGIRDGYIDKWDLFCSDDLAREEFQVVAAEALAYVKEKLSVNAVYGAVSTFCGHTDPPNHNGNCNDCTEITTAVLALLDEPTPDPERREG